METRPDNEFNVGIALGEQVGSRDYAGTPALLLMYDSIKDKPPEGMVFNLNLATPLIEGMGQSLKAWPPAAGVDMIGDWQRSRPTLRPISLRNACS